MRPNEFRYEPHAYESEVGRVRNSVFRFKIAFATVSKPFPALSGRIQSVLILELMNHPCQFAAFLSPVSVFGYGAHRMILRAHPDHKVIVTMPNFYESAAIESEHKKPQPKRGLS
jgi:hypothetical protein